MRHAYIKDEREHHAFAEAAARHFQAHPKHWTYSSGEVEPHCLLALRWGLGNDCVLVVRLNGDEPTVYGQLICTVDAAEGAAP